jgi:phospholipid/cholesterol/gamma-HCH transport system substrate-binding protein
LESKTNYTRVGAIVVILIIGLITASLWLSIGFDRKKYETYLIYANEPVSGLNEESIVKYNGVKVGTVSNIAINQLDPQQVRIELQIEEGTPITISTEATLINQGITGNAYLGLSATSASPFPLQKTPGHPYPVIPYKRSFFGQLEKNINEVSTSIKRLFDKENTQAFKKILINIESFSDVLAKNKENFNKSLQGIPELITDLKKTTAKFSDMTGRMSAAGKQVSATMQSGKNTIDKISHEALPPIVILLQRLDLIAANLEKVSAQMRQNPSVVIRGTTPPKSGPGE